MRCKLDARLTVSAEDPHQPGDAIAATAREVCERFGWRLHGIDWSPARQSDGDTPELHRLLRSWTKAECPDERRHWRREITAALDDWCVGQGTQDD